MSWECALVVSIVFSVAAISSALIYCDIKSKEFDDEDEE